MKKEKAIVKIKCNNVEDGKVCGSSNLTKSGKNAWRTITVNGGKERVKVQRWQCQDCGKYNFSRLDGSPLEINNGGKHERPKR